MVEAQIWTLMDADFTDSTDFFDLDTEMRREDTEIRRVVKKFSEAL
jgi:hypothetical protein